MIKPSEKLRFMLRRYGPDRRYMRRFLPSLFVVLLVATAGFVALAAPSKADAAIEFRVVGGGWGHGIGMSQYGAQGFAKRGTTWPNILRYYYTGSKVTKLNSNPIMRVRMQGTLRAVAFTMGRGGTVSVMGTKIKRRVPAKRVIRFRHNRAGTMTLTEMYSFGKYRTLVGWSARKLVVMGPSMYTLPRFKANNNFTNRHYRGSYTVQLDRKHLVVVNNIRLEQYLMGVVPCEVPTGWNPHALRAQAVAARSYAWVARIRLVQPNTQDQMYCGIEEEERSTNAAVSATAGYYVTHSANHNRPIQAFFHSTSGGWTAAPKDVWGANATNYPWLAPKRDPWETLGGSPYASWTYYYPGNQLAQKLRVGVGMMRDATTTQNRSHRASMVHLVGSAASKNVTGSTAQSRLGLRTTRFDIERLEMLSSLKSVAAAGDRVVLTGTIPTTDTTQLCQRHLNAGWTCTTQLDRLADATGKYSVNVAVAAETIYALKRGNRYGPAVRVKVGA